jgi:DNA-binding CsgD family transcriptional regulator
VVGLALAGLLGFRAQVLRERRRARTLRTGLLAARADAQRFRQQSQAFARGLAQAIDTQLDAWSASAAEREVALLLLKGLSLKEIAAARSTSERTARQQALALYKKAGVAGRAELSAFFLEDLLAPPPLSG